MTILTFTWRKNKNNVQEIKGKYNVTAFTTNCKLIVYKELLGTG